MADKRITCKILIGKRVIISVVSLGVDRKLLLTGYEEGINRAVMLKWS
jgi:hypothetical protein